MDELLENLRFMVSAQNSIPVGDEIIYHYKSKQLPDKSLLDGRKLTRVTMAVDVHSRKDIEKVIEFLEVTKHCFLMPIDKTKEVRDGQKK